MLAQLGKSLGGRDRGEDKIGVVPLANESQSWTRLGVLSANLLSGSCSGEWKPNGGSETRAVHSCREELRDVRQTLDDLEG